MKFGWARQKVMGRRKLIKSWCQIWEMSCQRRPQWVRDGSNPLMVTASPPPLHLQPTPTPNPPLCDRSYPYSPLCQVRRVTSIGTQGRKMRSIWVERSVVVVGTKLALEQSCSTLNCSPASRENPSQISLSNPKFGFQCQQHPHFFSLWVKQLFDC